MDIMPYCHNNTENIKAMLPASAKTEIAVTALESEWNHILNTRLRDMRYSNFNLDMKAIMEIAEIALIKKTDRYDEE
jgi:hypothetical protein